MGAYELTMVICSIVFQECTDPHPMPTHYNNFKECVQAGHQEAIDKLDDFKVRDVNNNMIHVKFACVRSVDS